MEFLVTLKVTVNTAETVSAAEIRERFNSIAEVFDSGVAEVVEVIES